MHEKINTLSTRVRQLEDALQVSHSRQSIEPHPLLTEELLKLKKPLEKGNESENAQSTGANFREHIGKGTGESELDSADELIDKAGSLLAQHIECLLGANDMSDLCARVVITGMAHPQTLMYVWIQCQFYKSHLFSQALMKVFEPIVTALKSKLKTLFTERRL